MSLLPFRCRSEISDPAATRPGVGLIPAILSLAAVFLAPLAAMGAPVTQTVGPWDVTYYNAGDTYSGGYVGAKDWSAAEMSDIAAMLNVWDQSITNAPPPRQMKLVVIWGALGTGVLGSTYTDMRGNGTHAATDVESLWREHENFVNSTADGFIQFGTGITWNIGPDHATYSEIDFRSVVAHEIGHLMGFNSTYEYDSNNDRFSTIGITAWDALLRDAATNGNRPAPGRKGTPSNFNETANPVYFVGQAATAYNQNTPVAVYAPSPFSDGSSLSHLNDATFPKALMKHAISYGAYARTPTMLEWEIMQDLGWSVQPHFLPGDANYDGVVDQADYKIWYDNYGTGNTLEQADFNGDKIVDQDDYKIWYDNYGKSNFSVPEPASISLLLLGVVALRRRKS
jgi:hypothetical protein